MGGSAEEGKGQGRCSRKIQGGKKVGERHRDTDAQAGSSTGPAPLSLADPAPLPSEREPGNQPGGAEATCLAISSVLVT